MNEDRERRLRERSRVLREHRASIDKLIRQSAYEIEMKYKRIYGDNWREALSYEQASEIERLIMNEKLTSSNMLEQHMLILKSNR